MVTCNPSRTPVDTESKLGLEDLSYGTLDLGLHLYASSTTSLVGYTDADWAGCPSTRSAEAEYQGVANIVAKTTWLRNILRELHSPLSTTTLVYCDNVSVVYMPTNSVQHQRMKHIEIYIHFIRDMVTAGQEGESKYEMGESSSAQIHLITGEPIHRTIPLLVARLVRHDDQIEEICNHQGEISATRSEYDVRIEILEQELETVHSIAEAFEARVQQSEAGIRELMTHINRLEDHFGM
ncbi:ribonuclease H-like domain-containing protein [Tanacetum coccineum]|uniref:Ribonuclease H-like domain-containing protein n=1 Tax=Tanacetum coccineum TaxID=301880 RepID=A0ABQ5AIH7_9ASTR